MDAILLLGPPDSPDDRADEFEKEEFLRICRRFLSDHPTKPPFRLVRELLERGRSDARDLGPLVD